jgi:hypothetical protein
MQRLAPIVLFVYNRAGHTKRTLSALARDSGAAESDLFVYSDGPKRVEDAKAVEEVRGLVRSARGFGSVTLIERPRNFGLSRSITSGVSEICERFGHAIVLEDDLVVAPGFLQFMNGALTKYRDEPRVMQISAYMYPLPNRDRACFLPTTSCWGWATWADRWAGFDLSGANADKVLADKAQQRHFNLLDSYDYTGMLRRQLGGELDSWGVLWYLYVFIAQGLVLYPPSSLVQNEGFDGSGTHCAPGSGFRADAVHSFDTSDIKWPDSVEVDEAALKDLAAFLRKSQPSRIMSVLKRVLA